MQPFSVRPGTGQAQADQVTVSADGATLYVPQLVLAPRTAAPAPIPVSTGASLAADPTTGMPFSYDPQGNGIPLVDNEPGADWNSLGAWTFDPAGAGAVLQLASGTIRLMRMRLAWPRTISAVGVLITTGGATLTAGQNFLAWFNSLGQQLGVSGDMTTAFAGTGYTEGTLTTPVKCLAGDYYVAALSNGTTPPTLLAGSTLASGNPNLTAGVARFLTGPAAQTSMPATITLASQTLSTGTIWAAAR